MIIFKKLEQVMMIYIIFLLCSVCSAAQHDPLHNIQAQNNRIRESVLLQRLRGCKDAFGLIAYGLAAFQFYSAYTESNSDAYMPDREHIARTVALQLLPSSLCFQGGGHFLVYIGRYQQSSACRQRTALSYAEFKERYKRGYVYQAIGNTFKGLGAGIFTRCLSNLIWGKVGAVIDAVGGLFTCAIPTYYWSSECNQTNCSAYHEEDDIDLEDVSVYERVADAQQTT